MSVATPTNEHTALNDFIERERAAAQPRAALVAEYRRYVLGRQAVTLSAEMRKALAGLLRENGHPYVDNLCKLAVTTAADYNTLARLDVAGPEGADRDALAAFLDELWMLNQIPELEARANVATYRDGDHAIALDWSKRTKRVRLFALRWWNGATGVFVHYDDTGLADWAVNEWRDGEIARRVIWYPGEFRRYQRRDAGQWEPYLLPEDGGVWPQPWTFRTGDPVGIPVVHFPCAVVPNDEAGDATDDADPRYGLSLLSGGALGIQDAINDAAYDLIAAARRSAFPVYTATGVALPPDPANPGRTLPLDTSPGALLHSPSSDAAFGMIAPGDMSQLAAVIAIHTRNFARATNTPMQIVNEEGTDAQSGVALYRMQLAAVRQAARQQTVRASRWGSVGHKASLLLNAFGGGTLRTDAPYFITGAYDPIEASDIGILAEVGKRLAEMGMPLEEILQIFGRTEQDVARILEAKRREQAGMHPPPAPAPAPPPAGTASGDAATQTGQPGQQQGE